MSKTDTSVQPAMAASGAQISPARILPAQILIVRHAEKPGLAEVDQESDGPDLSTRGFGRAAAMAYLLTERTGPIDFVIAAADSKHSSRPRETVTPLADRLNLQINLNHPQDDFQGLADAVFSHDKYAGKTPLVCWHHGKIPDLAAALGVVNPPRPWPPQEFDRIWVITFASPTATLSIVPQCILFGDSET